MERDGVAKVARYAGRYYGGLKFLSQQPRYGECPPAYSNLQCNDFFNLSPKAEQPHFRLNEDVPLI